MVFNPLEWVWNRLADGFNHWRSQYRVILLRFISGFGLYRHWNLSGGSHQR